MSTSVPVRSRGTIALLAENCTSCLLCAQECPNWCIHIQAHPQSEPARSGGRARTRQILDSFVIDFSVCMYCGICVQVCPFDALFWSPQVTPDAAARAGLRQDRDRLAASMPSVPPPVPLDEKAADPAEVVAARRTARRGGQPR